MLMACTGTVPLFRFVVHVLVLTSSMAYGVLCTALHHRRSGVALDKLSELHGCIFVEQCDVCHTEYERPYDGTRAPPRRSVLCCDVVLNRCVCGVLCCVV